MKTNQASTGHRTNKGPVALASVEERHRETEAPQSGVVLGTIASFTSSGRPRVDLPAPYGGAEVEAEALAPLSRKEIGREVAVMFANNDLNSPIVIGPVLAPSRSASSPDGEVNAMREGGRLVLSAAEEIELRCGSAHVVLNKAGKDPPQRRLHREPIERSPPHQRGIGVDQLTIRCGHLSTRHAFPLSVAGSGTGMAPKSGWWRSVQRSTSPRTAA